MGHSAEEKINILYQDSLKDIKDLAVQMLFITDAIKMTAEIVDNAHERETTAHEEMLVKSIDRVAKSVENLTNLRGAIQEAAKEQSDYVIRPIADVLHDNIKYVSGSYSTVLKAIETMDKTHKKTNDIHQKANDLMLNALLIVFIFTASSFAVGFFLGKHW